MLPLPLLDKLRKRYEIDNVVFVADSGLFNEDNLTYLEKSNINYIVGARIKNTNKELQEEILDLQNYKQVTE